MVEETWERVNPKGQKPSPRKGHSMVNYLNYFLVFGGQGESGYYSDLYRYNTITNNWQQISISGPSGLKGACIAVSKAYLVIYGGEFEDGTYSDETWVFEFSRDKIYKLGKFGPRKLNFPTCFFRGSDFFVMGGLDSTAASSSEVWKLNLTQGFWTKLSDQGYLEFLNAESAVAQVDQDTHISVGGYVWGYSTSKTVSSYSFENNSWSRVGAVDFYFYSGASAYFKNSIYIHGGGTSAGKILRSGKNSADFFKVSEASWKCSTGTYFDSECRLCPSGTSNPSMGSPFCFDCSEGKYSPNYGAFICSDCPEGTYSNEKGSKECKDCAFEKFCPPGSAFEQEPKEIPRVVVEQPSAYSGRTSYRIMNLLSILMICLVFVALLLLASKFQKARKFLPYFDIYTDKHTNRLGEPVVHKKTYTGGMFSILFVVLAVLFSINTILIFYIENVEETKGLVPLVTVFEDYKFKAEVLVNAKFSDYGAECQKDFDVYLSYQNINSDSLAIETFKEAGDCLVSVKCTECEIKTGAQINLELSSFRSSTPLIQVTTNSSSSIPEERSAVSVVLQPEFNQVFIGREPSVVNFRMTPSVFESEVSSSQETGYHVSLGQNPTLGSTSDNSETSFITMVKLQLQFDYDNVVLNTQRKYRQDVTLLINSLMGFVFGLLETVAIAMKYLEETNEKVTDYLLKKRNMRRISKGFRNLLGNLADVNSKLETFKPKEKVKPSQVMTVQDLEWSADVSTNSQL